MKRWMLYTGIAGAGVYLLRRMPRHAPAIVLKRIATHPSGRTRTKDEIRDAILVSIAGIRYPPDKDEARVLSHFLDIEAAAKTFRLEPALIASMIHIETRGISNLKTWEKAGFFVYGLMQVRATTADLVTRDGLMRPVGDHQRLIQDQVSIYYGAAYLRWQMNRYRNKMLKVRWAVAAYNRGTARWDSKNRTFSNNAYVLAVVDKKLPRYVYLFTQIYKKVGRTSFAGTPLAGKFEARGCYGCQR